MDDSLWLSRPATDRWPRLERDLHVDVVVVGCGIVGATTALTLAGHGRSVALVEARTIGSGATGNSTGKCTLQHAANLAPLIDRFGLDDARTMVDGDRAALDVVRHWTPRLGLDGSVQSVHSWTYATVQDRVADLEREVEAAARLGIDARMAEPGEQPFGVAAVGVPDQLLIDPVALCRAFVRHAASEGVDVYEDTRIVDVRPGDPHVVACEHGPSISAGTVVLATHVPILDRTLVFAGCDYVRSHVVALEHAEAWHRMPDMYTGIGPGGLSVRPATGRGDDATPLVLVAGGGHGLDTDEDGNHVDQLTERARELTGAGTRRAAWLAHDAQPVDGRPFIGTPAGLDRLYVATGFAGWGLSRGIAASLSITGCVLRGHARWAPPMDAARLTTYLRPGVARLGLKTVREFVGDRVGREDVDDVAELDLAPGSGRVVRLRGELAAVARDADGELHAVSARCTHLGCIVHHDAERSCWQCPCHGSRFALDGTVLEGPATDQLDAIDVPAGTADRR